MSESTKQPEQSNNRWWESYLVRYFLGFIVGVICVAVLAYELLGSKGLTKLISVATSSGSQAIAPENQSSGPSVLSGAAKPDWSAVSFAVALLGMGYCYLVSTPITVLHAGRYGRGSVDSLSRYFWMGWVLALVVGFSSGAIAFTSFRPIPSGIFLLLCVGLGFGCHRQIFNKKWFPCDKPGQAVKDMFACKSSSIEANGGGKRIRFELIMSLVFAYGTWMTTSLICGLLDGANEPLVFRFILFGMPVIWIGLVQYFVLYRILSDESGVINFYARLFHARRQEGSRDVRETYTHLREHSNSIFVVLVELSWLAMILGIVRLTGFKGAASSSIEVTSAGVSALFAIGIWVVPTIFMWSRANAMERMFADSPSTFLTDPTTNPIEADARSYRSRRS